MQALLPESAALPSDPALHIPPEHLRVYQQGKLIGHMNGGVD